MIHDILRYYLDSAERRRRFIPIDVDVLTPDLYMYLFASSIGWFVVIEADCIYLDEIIANVEKSFPVHFRRWRTLLEYQDGGGEEVISQTNFPNRSDDDIYDAVVYEDNTKYALLEVKPNPGIDETSFGLSFYQNVNS